MNPFELITPANAVKPNYDLSNRQFSFDIYLNFIGDICILGRLDNNYICGLSFSDVLDLGRTQTIINGMMNAPRSLVSHEYTVLGERYHEIRRWYRMKLSQRSASDGELLYTMAGIDYHFSLQDMAEQIQVAYTNLSKTCQTRLADGLYLPVLHSYHKLLTRYKRGDSEAPEYYHKMRSLIDIVKTESYIKLSPESVIRELYLSIVDASDSLYNAYMDVAR